MKTFAILRRSAWQNSDVAGAAVGRSDNEAAQMSDQIRRLRTYVLNEGGEQLGSICIYEGVDEAAIRDHASRADLSVDEVVEVVDTVVYPESA